jgi:hypothetical protein
VNMVLLHGARRPPAAPIAQTIGML